MSPEVLAVIVGVGILYAFYRAVEVQWPESYFPVSRTLDRAIASGPFRYALFRFCPPTVVMATVAGVLANDHHAVVVPVMAIGVVHALLTSGVAVVQDVRHGTARIRPLVLVYRLLVAAACIVCVPIALVLGSVTRKILPSTHEFGVSMWTAALAGVLGGYLLSISRRARSEPDADLAFRESRRLIGDDLWEVASNTATSVGATPGLVQAVLLVENLQRPRWVRRLERLGARVVGVSTCGPLQVTSRQRPDTDENELVRAIRSRFAGQAVPRKRTANGYEYDDYDWLQLFLAGYNPDPQWQGDVRSAYQFVQRPQYPTLAKSENVAHDGRPVIEVTSLKQVNGRYRVSGTASAAVLAVRQLDRAGKSLSREVATVDADPPRRGDWTCAPGLASGATGLIVTVEQEVDVAGDSVRLPIVPTGTGDLG